jgi:hypothetical protein
LGFVRDLGLQLVLATPKEKADVVVRHVGTSLLIDKDPISGVPTIFNFRREDLVPDYEDSGSAPQEGPGIMPPDGIGISRQGDPQTVPLG